MEVRVNLVTNKFRNLVLETHVAHLRRSSSFYDDCLPGPISPQDYRMAKVVEQGSKLLNRDIVKELDAIQMLKVMLLTIIALGV